MPVIAVIIESFTAFSDCKVIVISPRCFYVEKISSALASPNPFAVNAFHFLFIVVVRHSSKILQLKILVYRTYKYKYVFETAKLSASIVYSR